MDGITVERRGLSIFATYACHTAEWTTADADDNGQWDTWQRWDSVFAGGLRARLGSHDLVYIGGHDNIGKIFAEHLNAGHSLGYAWYYALRASDAGNGAAALFSGNSSTDCSQRRSDMSWDNFDSFPRRPNRKRSCSDELAHGWSDARSCAVCFSIGLSMRAL